jgi:hypothetical protein
MDLPSTIPTSFVPHPASSSSPSKSSFDLSDAFGFIAYLILAVVFVAAIGVFFYGRVLASDQASKDAQLQKVTASIDSTTIDSLLRLQNRLNSSKTLLANHVAFSNFFSLLDTLMPSTVRFAALHLSLNDDGTVSIDGSGVAKSFNSLAFASTEFATDGRIKDAIFSNIAVSPKDGSVSFDLFATLDPSTVAFSP